MHIGFLNKISKHVKCFVIHIFFKMKTMIINNQLVVLKRLYPRSLKTPALNLTKNTKSWFHLYYTAPSRFTEFPLDNTIDREMVL